MKTTIVRAAPVQPPIQKIILEVTPAELTRITRATGRAPMDGENKPLFFEVHGNVAAHSGEVYDALKAAMSAAGLSLTNYQQ